MQMQDSPLEIYSQAQLIAKKAAQQRLVEAILPEGVADSPPSIVVATAAIVLFWSDLERRNYPKRRLSYSFYGGHSRIRTYDFHRVNGKGGRLNILKGLIAV